MVHDGGRRKPGGSIARNGALSLEMTRVSKRNTTHSPRLTRPVSLLLLCALLVLTILPSTSLAQGIFGKNKVQYSERRWFKIDGNYVTVYFYSEEKEIASAAMAIAESTAAMLSDTLQHRLSKKIPLVLFSSPRDFQQSNIIPYLLPEAVGGLTEFVKGRVLVPYTGSRYRFRWVLRHELTHAFMLDKIEATLNRTKRTMSFYPPLWLSEGLAEYMSAVSNPAAETILRDAVLSERVVGIDEMWRIENSILVYREGQSLVAYMADTFGFSSIVRLLENWGSEPTFEATVEKTFGISTRELSRRWVLTLKTKYYPEVAVRDWVSSFADSTISGERFGISPVWVRLEGGRGGVAYLSSEGETPELRFHELGGRGRDRLLVRGGTSRQFESLHLFRSRLSVNKDGILVFSAQREESDVVHLFDLKGRRRKTTIAFPGLVSVSSPSWSRDETKLGLSGQDASGRSGLFVVSLKERSIHRLTSDFYDDRDPDWSPDGNWMVFSSDRCPGCEDGVRKLFLISPATGGILQVTSGIASDSEPRWSTSGRYIVFVSDRGGVPDLFLLDVESLKTARLTMSLAGVMTPAWGDDDASLYFTALSSGEYHVYRVGVSPESLKWEGPDQPEIAGKPVPETRPSPWGPSSTTERSVKPYDRKFGLDIVRGAMGYDPEFAQTGSGQVALSDVLGNEHLLFYLSSQSEFGGNLLGSLSGGVTYLNLSRRLSYGVGVFSLGVVYDEELGLLREERRTGLLLLGSYPVSRFERFDATLVSRFSHDYLYRDGEKARTLLVSNYFSYVWDNSVFETNGEIAGTRANLTFGLTRDITRGKADYLSALVDLRENVSITRKALCAFRVLVKSSFGSEGTRFYMGGPWSLRGYATRAMSGKTLFLINNELRLPGLARIVLGLPGQRLPLPTLRGAVFADAGAAGEKTLDNWRGSLGLGVYVGGGYFPIVRFNTVWRTDFTTVEKKPVHEFFVGWNF